MRVCGLSKKLNFQDPEESLRLATSLFIKDEIQHQAQEP